MSKKRAGIDDYTMRKHTNRAEEKAAGFTTLTLGNGDTAELPRHKGDDGGTITDFTGVTACKVCSGYPDGSWFVGGVIPHKVRRNGILYKEMTACPECVYGGWWHKYHGAAFASSDIGQKRAGPSTTTNQNSFASCDTERPLKNDLTVQSVVQDLDIAF